MSEIQTPEDVRKAIHDIRERQQELADRGDDARQNMDAKLADLKTATQALLEQQKAAPVTISEGERSVERYIEGDSIRAVTTTDRNGVSRKGLLDDTPRCEWQEDLQRLAEQRSWVKVLTKSGDTTITDAQISDHLRVAPVGIRRIFSDGTAALGGAWVPDIVLPQMERELILERRVEALFPTYQMAGKEERLPFLSLGLVPYLRSVPTTDDPTAFLRSTMTAAQRSITASSFSVSSQLDEDGSEDSVIAAMETVRQEAVTALVDGFEDAIINGDTTASHQDLGTVGSPTKWDIRGRWGDITTVATDHRRGFVGLRARATDVSNTTDQGSAESFAGFMTARAKLDSPHGVAGSLVCIVSPEYLIAKMMEFSQVLTLEKYGANATILTGQLASLGGVPIIVSEFVGADLNTAGIHDGSTETKTGMLLLNRDRFRVGTLKSSTVELDKDIIRGCINVVSTRRAAFYTIDSASKKNVHWSYNLSKS